RGEVEAEAQEQEQACSDQQRAPHGDSLTLASGLQFPVPSFHARIPDPGSRIPDPGSRIDGERYNVLLTSTERDVHVYNYFDHTDLHAVLAEGRRFEICDRSRLQWRPSGAAAGE